MHTPYQDGRLVRENLISLTAIWWKVRHNLHRFSRYYVQIAITEFHQNWTINLESTNSNLLCGNKMPTRCNRGFIADLTACSTTLGHHYAHQLRVMCPVCRMLQHPANRTYNPQLHTRPATWKTTARNTTGSNHCIILLSSWWWA